jgi:hypothetical protein
VAAARVGLALAPSAAIAVVSVGWMCLDGRSPGGHGLAAAQLVWLCPLLALSGLGLSVAIGSSSATVGTGTVAVAWLWEQIQRNDFAKNAVLRPLFLFQTTYQPHTTGWMADRIALASVAVLGLGVSWVALSRPDRLLKAES